MVASLQASRSESLARKPREKSKVRSRCRAGSLDTVRQLQCEDDSSAEVSNRFECLTSKSKTFHVFALNFHIGPKNGRMQLYRMPWTPTCRGLKNTFGDASSERSSNPQYQECFTIAISGSAWYRRKIWVCDGVKPLG